MTGTLRLLTLLGLSALLAATGCDDGEAADDDDSAADDDTGPADDDTTPETEITLAHDPATSAVEGEDLALEATVTDPLGVVDVVVHYRNLGETDLLSALLVTAGGDLFSGILPGATISSEGLEYYVQATGGSGMAVAPAGAPAELFQVAVENVAPVPPIDGIAWYDWAGEAVRVEWVASASLDLAVIEVWRSDDATVDGSDTLVASGDGTLLSATDPDDEDGTLSTAYHFYALRLEDAFGLETWSGAAVSANLHLYDGFIGNPSPVPMASDGGFALPTGIAVDAGGQVYVADSSNHRVQVFRGDGEFLRKFGSQGTGEAEFQLPWDVAVSSRGDVWVAEYQNHRVQLVGSTGLFLAQVGTGTNSEAEGGFWFPIGVTVDSDDYVYVVDDHNPRVQKFTPDGAADPVAVWTTAGGTPFAHLGGVAYDPRRDALIVTDSGLDQVFVLDTDGGLLDTFASPGTGPGQVTEPHGPCGTPSGFTVVTDGDSSLVQAGSHRVSTFDPSGEYSFSFGQFGSDETEFSIASDCASAPDGTLWVVNRYDYRVHRYGP